MIPRPQQTAQWLAQLHRAAAASRRPLAFMEICGTHTMAAFRCGLHSLLPANVRLISGPGCPVCVTSQGDIDQMIELAQQRSQAIRLCTYGDMLRVPGRHSSLEQARGQGADVQVIYSAMDAVAQAQALPQRQVVLIGIGFETTAPASAAAILAARRQHLSNFSVLVSHKRVLPAVTALFASGQVQVDGLICPGHVSVMIGAAAYKAIVSDYQMPCAIAGFEEAHMAAALAQLAEQACKGEARLDNLYPRVVTDQGNVTAQRLLKTVFEPTAAAWRGLGVLPASGMALRPEFHCYDAARRFGLQAAQSPEPDGCRCGQVITGRITPDQCPLFARLCTPIHPVGPCMVSSEGACQAWFKYNRTAAGAGRAAAAALTTTGSRS